MANSNDTNKSSASSYDRKENPNNTRRHHLMAEGKKVQTMGRNSPKTSY